MPAESRPSALRLRLRSSGCNSSTPPHRGRTAVTRPLTGSCGWSSISCVSTARRSASRRGIFGRAQQALAKRLVAIYTSGRAAVVARRDPRRSQPRRPHLPDRDGELGLEAGHGSDPPGGLVPAPDRAPPGAAAGRARPAEPAGRPRAAAERNSIEGQLAAEQPSLQLRALADPVDDRAAAGEPGRGRRRLQGPRRRRRRRLRREASASGVRQRRRSRRRATAVSSASRCGTSARRTSGAVRARAASTAPAS